MSSEGRAAVLTEAGKPVEVIDITLDPPGPGEVQVRVVASGVCHTELAIKMPAEMPLDKACLIACGVVTGVGAAMNTAPVFPGASVAVIGCGGVGLSVIQGARLQNARQIIAVDVNPVKLEWAKKFGATDFVNAKDGDP